MSTHTTHTHTHICTFSYSLLLYGFFFRFFSFCLNYLSRVSIMGQLKKKPSLLFLLLLYMLLLYMTFAIVTYEFSINGRFLLGVIPRSEVTRSGSMCILCFDSYILTASKRVVLGQYLSLFFSPHGQKYYQSFSHSQSNGQIYYLILIFIFVYQ